MQGPEDRFFNIVVLGLAGVGKTSFIDNASNISMISKERIVSPAPDTSRRRNVKRVSVDNDLVLDIASAPASQIPDDIKAMLFQDTTGVVFIVDSTDKSSFQRAGRLIAAIRERFPTPIVVAANSNDLLDVGEIDKLRTALQLAADMPLIPYIAAEKETIEKVLLETLYWIVYDIEQKD